MEGAPKRNSTTEKPARPSHEEIGREINRLTIERDEKLRQMAWDRKSPEEIEAEREKYEEMIRNGGVAKTD